MKKIFMKWAFFMLCMAVTMPAMAQFNVKALKGAAKAVKAVTHFLIIALSFPTR